MNSTDSDASLRDKKSLFGEGEYENLPPDVYARGFVKRYASFLGLDSERIVFLYKFIFLIHCSFSKKSEHIFLS